MCARYYLEISFDMRPFIEKMMDSLLAHEWEKMTTIKTSGEVFPTDVVPVIATNRAGGQSVFPMKWGFDGKNLLINARVETVSEKATFKDAWKSHRCIVPASHYFEWEHLVTDDGKKKTGAKYAIKSKDPNLWLCGLYRFENNMPVFVILTREASENIRFIHDRMPLIMPDDLKDEWIRPEADPKALINSALNPSSFTSLSH